MKWREEYLPEIIEKLKKIKPYKIIVFGSIANNESGRNSYIDLLVILTEKGAVPLFAQDGEQW